MAIIQLSSPTTALHGVGPAISQRLAKLGITQVFHLLFHYPKRYQDFSDITLIEHCQPGDTVTLAATVKRSNERKAWRRRNLSIVEAEIEDQTGTIKCTWFNQPYVINQLEAGTSIFVSGRITEHKKYGLTLTNPLFEAVQAETTHTARIIPMYPLTKGVSQKQLRYYVKQALEILQNDPTQLPKWVPNSIVESFSLLPMAEAIQQIHFPDSNEQAEAARYRLGFNELLIIQLFVQATKQSVAQEQSPVFGESTAATQRIVEQLPFELTPGQQQALQDIMHDTSQAHPMNRLLEGDVGAGKTIVAALAMHHAAQHGYQSALMAPTALLAEQHYNSLMEVLPNEITVALLTGTTKQDIANADVVVGTHALIQKTVSFSNLGLAIIDEQHRFGVQQRKQLKEYSTTHNTTPHLLSMTATPIPRSLALTVYGDLSLSLLEELPAGRKPVITHLLERTSDEVYASTLSQLQLGHQVYVVAPAYRGQRR